MIITTSELPKIRRAHEGGVIVLAGGGFDLMHAGHLDYLEFSKKQGDVLVVAIASDTDLRRRKGSTRPVITEERRARMLDSLKVVDYVLVRDDSDLAASTIRVARALRPDKMVFGNDLPLVILKQIKTALPAISILIDDQMKVDSTTDIIARAKV